MKLIFLLGDQLSPKISSLKDVDKKNDVVMLCEVFEETQYVKHHKKKIAFIFSAMRHFANELKDNGYSVRYVKLADPNNTGSFTGELKRAIKILNPKELVITYPGEYRVLEMIQQWKKSLNIPVILKSDDRFLCDIDEFKQWAKGKKQLRMEYFYREMRKKYNLLMDGGEPVGGSWNFDSQNRKVIKNNLEIPNSYHAEIDDITKEVIQLIEKKFNSHFGDVEPFYFAVTRKQALYALQKFIDERLAMFGDYQDAMLSGEPFLFHSHLSFYLNCGLLLPLECVEAAENAFRSGKAPLNAAEGFIRQIIGWREYVRGIYWLKMPSYESKNFLLAKRNLPDFFWDGNTKLNCLKQCIDETKQNAYAHHIQRLMVLGNFLLLIGCDPEFVNDWYLIVYADAYQWVELPNVTGMILFADGGLLASKPYAASGAYINKMSNYCGSCDYNVKEKQGSKACPFNYLYWDFLIKNKDKLKDNARLKFPYNTLGKMSHDRVAEIQHDAKNFLDNLK